MKTERLIFGSIILTLLIVIILLSTCGKGNVDKGCTNTTDTLIVTERVFDTIAIEKTYAPRPRKILAKNEPIKQKLDSLYDFDWTPYLTIGEQEEHTYFYYLDTITGQDVEVIIADTSLGFIVGRNVRIVNNRPTDIISKYLIPNQAKAKVFIGANVGYVFNGQIQVLPSMGLLTKQDLLFTLGAGYSNVGPIVQGGVYAKLKFK